MHSKINPQKVEGFLFLTRIFYFIVVLELTFGIYFEYLELCLRLKLKYFKYIIYYTRSFVLFEIDFFNNSFVRQEKH